MELLWIHLQSQLLQVDPDFLPHAITIYAYHSKKKIPLMQFKHSFYYEVMFRVEYR